MRGAVQNITFDPVEEEWADAAPAARARHEAPPARLPQFRPADGAVWSITALLAIAAAAGIAGGLAWIRRPPPAEGIVEKRIGERMVAAPSAWLGPRPDDQAREIGILRLRLSWPSFAPPGPGRSADLHITVSPPLTGQDGSVVDRLELLKMSARFVQPTAWSNPGGLVARDFRPGSPFEGDELFLSAPDGNEFVARCTNHRKLDEGCRTMVHHAGFDVALRFPREALTDWPRLIEGTRALIDRIAP